MEEVRGNVSEGILTIALSGRVDSNNATEVEQETVALLEQNPDVPVILDIQDLEYISSAGLRVLLHLKKIKDDFRIINANSEVYEIFDMTGFNQMMNISKAYRQVSVEGCEVIGQGANGTIYRIDSDNVVKVYNDADALDDIQHEREVAKLALVLGVPTAISYDVVKIGDSYGSVFELLDARSFSKIMATEPEKLDWCVKEYVDMLRIIHSTVVPKGKLPDMKKVAVDWGRFVTDYLPEEYGQKLLKMIQNIPEDDHMIHGDYHTKNLELTGDEVLLIDMDTLAVGHPVFELASMFNAYIGFSEMDKDIILKFQGFDYNTASAFWKKTLEEYLGTKDPEDITAVENKARIIGYTRLIRRSIRRQGLETEKGRAEIEHWKQELIELLDQEDSLYFSNKVLEVDADVDQLAKVNQAVEEALEAVECPMKAQIQVTVAVEELFVNIAKYAYEGGEGKAKVRIFVQEKGQEKLCSITFEDHGVPYDPLAKEDPDVTLSAQERQIGGLGIFMAKQNMDDMVYKYEDGKNILKISKRFQ